MIQEIQEYVQLIRLLALYKLSTNEIKRMNKVSKKLEDQDNITDQEIWELYVYEKDV